MDPSEHVPKRIQHVDVYGIAIDERTGCHHYRSARDIIAIRLKCCNRFYGCVHCHDATTDHQRRLWTAEEFNEAAILCGACGQTLSITAYLNSAYQCPYCKADFNPKCRHHYPYYFEGKWGV